MIFLKRSSLRNLCTLVTDGTHDTPKIQSSGFPLIKAKEINKGKIDFENCELISEMDHLKVISRSKPEKGDTLFTHIGASLGLAAYVDTDREFSIKNIALFKPDPTIVNNKYFYYLIIGNEFQSFIKNKKGGSAQPFVGLDTLRTHELSFIENLGIQDQIAVTLSAYDDLIENNRHRIKILKEMARSLFREWFIYFRYPGHESVPLVSSPLGPIPKGWEVKSLGDIGDFRNGINYLRNDSGDTEYFIANVRDISHDKILLTECFDKIHINSSKAKEYLLEKNDILIARSACPGEASLIVPHVENVIYSGFSIRFRLNKPENLFYMFNVLLGLRKVLSNFSTGTAMKSVNQETLKNTKVLYPNNILSDFKKVIEPLYAQIIILMKKNNNLAKTRDLLLPRLLSGRIPLKEKVPIA